MAVTRCSMVGEEASRINRLNLLISFSFIAAAGWFYVQALRRARVYPRLWRWVWVSGGMIFVSLLQVAMLLGLVGRGTVLYSSLLGAAVLTLLYGLVQAYRSDLQGVIDSARAESAVDEVASAMVALLHSLPLAAVTLDREGRVQSWNPAAEQIFGYREAEVLGGPLPGVAPAYAAEDRELLRRVLQGEAFFDAQTRRCRRDGSLLDVSLTMAPRKDLAGNVTSVIAVMAEFTERRRNEALVGLQAAVDKKLLLDQPRAEVLQFVCDQLGAIFDCALVTIASRADDGSLNSLTQAGAAGEAQPGAAALSVPLSAQGRDLGVLTLQPARGGNLSAGTAEQLATFGEQLARSLLAAADREQIRLLTAALEATPAGILITDRRGMILWANPAMTDLTGYAPSEMTGCTPRLFHSGLHEPAFYQEMWQTILAGGVWRGELYNRRKDGSLYSEEVTIAPVRGAGGAINHFVSVKQDISERKRLAADLQQSNEALQALVQHSPLAIFTLDVTGSVRVWNRAAEQIFGWPEAEVVGRPLPFVTPATAAEHRLLRERVLADAPFANVEVRRCRRDGTPVDLSLSGAPVRDARGNLTGFVGVAADITDRKRAEAEVRLLQSIALAIGEAPAWQAALGTVLQRVCEVTGWALGEAWLPRADGATLACSSVVYAADPALRQFHQVSSSYHFAPGEGLPGRAWAERRPVWVPDVTADSDFRRASLARRLGIRAGLAVPIFAGDTVVVVLGFYLTDAREQDERLIEVISAVAAQLGEAMQRKQAEEKLKAQLLYHATHDALTRLPNRYALEERLQQMLGAGAPQQTAALLMLDLDNFKLVNDTAGHAVGDQVLVAISRTLAKALEPEAFLARLGGDEFAVLLPRMPPSAATAVADRLRLAVDRFRFPWEGNVFVLSTSVGLAPVDGTLGAGGVLALADAALYAAKARGRNRTVVYFSEDQKAVDLAEAQRWTAQIKDALVEGRFQLSYQPIVDVQTGRPVYYEALIRMVDGDGRLIPPSAFIEVAERYGMMAAIDRWVIAAAVRTLQARPDLKLFVNLSGTSLGDDELQEFIEHALVDSGIEPERLGFEITETAVVADIAATMRWMNRLKAAGCRFALDDFGMGFSSFAYLRTLPADYIKLDRSFVRDVETDAKHQHLIRAMTMVAEALGKVVIAECVETEAAARCLWQQGVRLGQGYLWGAPLGDLQRVAELS